MYPCTYGTNLAYLTSGSTWISLSSALCFFSLSFPSLISPARHIAPKLHSAAISLPLPSSTTHQHTA
ncbi:hypothetical protein LMH87_007143 [Akanthomyces muscarius]|uniref:Uncharacterized protein n=1 Tax=Akanthomyces muscarius TaxID=2231603 RepID=A0A9W8QP42_AKAMU|nr:hypothetical protein LMH87_007143 [Akanthomyces muscarius]KAJ4165513.1 hypothetical protein LMH87_007143 [Akanthomyces muscarius]